MTKNDSLFPCGSQWRKWDLYVHSPASANFSGDWPGFVIQLGNSDCAVIGVNDYFSVAGYKELIRRLNDPHDAANGNKAYREALDKLGQNTLLPVVECRMTNVVLGKKNTSGQRINFHVIFSDAVNPDDIEAFIKGIKVKDQSVGGRYNDPKFLLNEVSVDFHKVPEQLNGDVTFKCKFVVWIPYDEYGGIGDIDPKTDKLLKEGLVYGADILGSGNRKQADFFLWKDANFAEADYRKWFGKRKPCIKGSDSHNVNEEIGRLKDHESKPTDRACWIKADRTFIQRGFARDFFDQHISQGVNGSFCGKEAGEQCLAELLEDRNFNDPDQATGVAERIEEYLNFDMRSAKRPSMQIAEQLRKHATVADLYDYLWSFSYLIPEYSLKLDGKDLTQLSPGERGALLLVFYLLVDKSDKPIIVDQPEENLDNQTVYHLLIPVIRAVKRRRQIIMVTHNPNIAVVCDAEQIIHASIDRTQGNRITYTSGSIENPVINKHVLDVLEGTRPAFDNREAKYYT